MTEERKLPPPRDLGDGRWAIWRDAGNLGISMAIVHEDEMTPELKALLGIQPKKENDNG
jgi:hypothetical protein